MPGPITHLYAAFYYNVRQTEKYPAEIYLGAVSPDSINVDGLAPKEKRWPAHLRDKDLKVWLNNAREFYLNNKGKTDEAFLKGYIIHLVTDIVWDSSFNAELYEKLTADGVLNENLKEERWNELYGYEISNALDQDHNALILWSGCLEEMDPIVIDSPTSTLDILPTLSNLFGVEYDSRLMVGRDVFSTDEAIIFFGGAGSWKTEKGTYSSRNNKFTPAEGVEVEDGYVKRINTIVRNKISYCKNVAKYDYFNYVADALKDAKGE